MVVPRSTKPGRTRGSVPIPEELRAALEKDATARAAFDGLPPSHQRETVAYVAEAKQSETRTRRSARTVAMLKDGTIRS